MIQTKTHLEEKIARVRPRFPALNYEKIERNNDGLAHEVVIVDRERVFRFPRDDWARRSLQQELIVLELLRPVFPAPLPAYDFVADDVASYPYLPGRPLTRGRWLHCDLAGRSRLAAQIGKMLSAMHAITPADDISSRSPLGPSLTVRQQADWEALYEDVQNYLYPGLMAHAREGVDDLFKHVVGQPEFMAAEPVLMNGDIGTYHMLFDESSQNITGVLDFGTAGWGDPACDVACLLYQYGEAFIRLMAETYPVSSAVIDRARFWARTLELQWAVGGLKRLPEAGIKNRIADWSWLTVHIGFGARDMSPIGSPL